MKLSVFDSNGEFTKFVSGDADSAQANVPSGFYGVESDAPLTDYWYDTSDGVVKQKQDYDLTALPTPCSIEIEGLVYEVTEQPQFEFDVPGEYEISVDAGPQYYKKVFNYDYNP